MYIYMYICVCVYACVRASSNSCCKKRYLRKFVEQFKIKNTMEIMSQIHESDSYANVTHADTHIHTYKSDCATYTYMRYTLLILFTTITSAYNLKST
jgi:hypothetical protein